MGNWRIIVPETATRLNYVLNPSGETTGNFSGSSATVTRILTRARFGIYSYQVDTIGSDRGIELTLSALPNAACYVSAYLAGGTSYTWYVGVTQKVPTRFSTGTWERWGVALSAAEANGQTALVIWHDTGPITFYADAIMVKQGTELSTYFDGDQRGGKWAGLRHASISTLDPQERGAGQERDFKADFGLDVRFMPGAGMPPITNNLQPLALQPGALFQSSKVQPRYIDFHLSYTDDTLAAFFKKRKDLIDLLKPDRTRSDQSCLLSYSGAHASKKAYIRARYDGGAEMKVFSADLIEQPVVRLLAEEPFFFEDNQEVAVLDFQDSVSSANYALRRYDGQWKSLGTGFGGTVSTIAVDRQRGRIYFGGLFLTGNGVTLNRVGYWNGTTFVAMDAGVNGEVKAIAVAPNGDVWIGGTFMTVGSGAAACKGLARWNIASSTWTAFNPSTTVFNNVGALAIAPDDGTLFVGGDFTDWNAIANADYIAKWDGSAWSALGTGMNGSVSDLVAIRSTLVYVGGAFTTGNGVTLNRIGYWNGTTFVAMGGGADAAVFAIAVARNGDVYIGGAFTSTPVSGFIAVWNGSSWSALGSGMNNLVRDIVIDKLDRLYACGSFSQAGGLSLADRVAHWNGSAWVHVDVDLPGAPTPRALAVDGDDLYVGFDSFGTGTASGLTTVTNNGTVAVYPIITLVGPSSGSATLQWLENQSSGHRLYFNLTVRAGEIITIDLRTGKKSVVSDWRGIIADNPLSNSDFGSFKLLPGANTVAAFITGTTTGVTLQMRWVPQHWSLEGVAA